MSKILTLSFIFANVKKRKNPAANWAFYRLLCCISIRNSNNNECFVPLIISVPDFRATKNFYTIKGN